MLSLLSSPLPISYHQHGHSYNIFVQPENPLQKDAAWENWAATPFSSLPPSVKCSSCLIHPYIKLTVEAGKWKENECHARTYFFNEFSFTPDSDPNPTIGSTWLAVQIATGAGGVGYKQPCCCAALAGHGPGPCQALSPEPRLCRARGCARSCSQAQPTRLVPIFLK